MKKAELVEVSLGSVICRSEDVDYAVASAHDWFGNNEAELYRTQFIKTAEVTRAPRGARQFFDEGDALFSF